MSRRNKSDQRFNAPFRDLDKRLRSPRPARSEDENPASPSSGSPPASPGFPHLESRSGPDDDAAVFERAMDGVRPIDRSRRRRPAPKRSDAAAGRAREDERGDVRAYLEGLTSGELEFDLTETGEYVEGCAPDLDRRALRRLRGGEMSVRDELDLHRMNRDEARAALDRFILDAVGRRITCVRVVHGRGLHSKEEGPVLKEKVVQWLSGRRLGKVVLAFTSARPVDGGTGALYVLLRKRPRP